MVPGQRFLDGFLVLLAGDRCTRALLLSLVSALQLWSTDCCEACLSALPEDVVAELPDFSFAGYHYGVAFPGNATLPVVDAQKFGVRANDGVDDRQALQEALDAAARAGGAIVQLPLGRLLIWTHPKDRGSLTISSSNIVLRGAGSGQQGTTIYQVWHGLTDDDGHLDFGTSLSTTPAGLEMNAPPLERAARARLIKDVARHGRVLHVESGHTFQPGMLVSLRVRSKEAVTEVLGGRQPPEAWERLHIVGQRSTNSIGSLP
jgi:hypothetical protein